MGVDGDGVGLMRIGLVGCGSWGKLVLRDLIVLGAEVSVVAPSEATRQMALAAGAVSAHATTGDLPEPDAYVVVSPAGTHGEVIETLIPRGRPIFVEKPLTNDLATAERILAAAPTLVFCMDKWRYHGGVLKLAELARSGALGEVLQISSWRLGWGNRHRDVDPAWYLAPHDLAIAYEILGFLPPVQTAFGTGTWGMNGAVSAFLKGEDGPGVAIEISTCHPVNRRSVVVVGSEGSAQFGGSYDEVVQIKRRDGSSEEIPIPTDMPLLAELRAFLDHVSGGPPPKSSAAEAVLMVRRIAEIRAMAGLA